MAQYGVTRRLERPRERVLSWMARVSAGLSEAPGPSEELVEFALAQDLRLTVFYLEGLLKLYRRRLPEAIEPHYQRVKALEDTLGTLAAARHIEQLAENCGLHESALQWCRRQSVQAKQSASAELEAWRPASDGRIPALASLLSILEATPFGSYKRDRRKLIAEIRRRIGKLVDTSLDMYELQGDRGMHELRRQLRWVPIYAVGLDGLIVTSRTHHPIGQYRSLLKSPVADSPYAQLPAPTREDRPIEISLSLFLRTTQLIEELGTLKDAGEDAEGLEHALIGGGVAATSAQARQQALAALGRSRAARLAIFERAETLYQELKRKRFFKRLRADFKS